jgi:4-hydroxy-2-oxoheptanedioate aldolase
MWRQPTGSALATKQGVDHTMPLPENRILQKAAAGETAIGMYIKTHAPEFVTLAGRAGLDFVRIDAYHGGMGPETIASLIRAAYANGLTPAVRVPKDPFAISSALESGAQSITFPCVESAAEARYLASLCYLPPAGVREASRPLFALGYPAAEYRAWARDQLIVSVQIESAGALKELQDIIAVDAVTMIQCGRSDLASSLGLPGGTTDKAVLAEEARVVGAALQAGKLVSMHFPPGEGMIESASEWLARKIPCITIGGDTQILHAALQQRLTAIGA